MTDVGPGLEGPAGLASLSAFTPTCDRVISYLRRAVPMSFWSVTRFDGTDQLYLSVDDVCYGKVVGDRHRWSDSFCQFSTTGQAPAIAPDAMAVPLYATAGVARSLKIGSYVGVPINHPDGTLFGTLCGLDPDVKPSVLVDQRPLFDLLVSMLSTILHVELRHADQARRLEQVEVLAETDVLTGLVNRRGWERYLALEEARYRRFGDPGSIIVVDLDGLKQINDSKGHAVGDAVLRLAADTIRRHVRGSDLVARLGGDEFGILAVASTPDQVDALKSRLRDAFAESGVAASIGCAPYTFSSGFAEAWERADLLMYEDKRQRHGQPGL